METISSILLWVQIVVSVLLIVAILLQRSEAGLGSAFGGENSGLYTKRGVEKWLFIATIVLAILFLVTSIVALLR